MPSVDERIVKIQFDNRDFEQRIASTITSLGQLDKALQFKNAAAGFAGINAAANTVNLAGMAAGVENISSKFTALGAIGFTVIQNLTTAVMGFIKTTGGDILSPILEGGFARAKSLEQARFMFQGLGVDVEKAMASAKSAVLGTAYGLGDAANAAAQFAASGIDVGDDMTAALRGVAGAAAMTGASFKDIAYIYSGIAGQNRVTSQDLMQFSTRGLNAAAAIAKSMGISEQAVRDMVSNGEMDFKTFAKAMDDAFGKHAQDANQTFVGALANMKAALSRLGASFFTPQLETFRDLFNAITPQIDNFTKAIQPAIDAFNVLSRFAVNQLISSINGISFDSLKAAMPDVVAGMGNIYMALKNIWNIGKQAFQQIFPTSFGTIIQNIAAGFRSLTEHLHVSVDGMMKIRSIFEGVFSVLSIGWTIVKEGIGFLADLGKSLLNIFGPGIVGGLTKISDFFTDLQGSLVKGGGIKSFFDGLEDALKKPLEFLEKMKDAVADFFDSFSQGAADKVGGVADGLGDRFDNLKERLGKVWEPFIDAMGRIVDALEPIAQGIFDWFKGLWDRLAEGLSSQDFSNILDALNTALLGGIAAMIAKFLKGGINFTLGAGWLNLGGTLQSVTNALQGMQTVLKAEALLKIGEAIALLAASLLVLSTIDSEALARALTAMSVGFGELIGAFAALEKLSGPKGALDFVAISSGMILLASALLILSVAVKILSTIEWDEMLIGLGGTVVLLGALSAASIPLSANSAGMIKAGIGIGAIATAMVVLAIAMKIMATMSWEEMAKGLVGVAGGLGAIVVALQLMPNDLALVKAGISILAIATALVILGGAVAIFASMNWESLGKGLLGVAVGLGAIVLAMNLMPKDMGASAASLLLVSVALTVMAVAIRMIADLSWEQLAKGLTGIAVSLGLLVGAAILMEGAIPGAGAMIIVATALLILSKAIQTIGAMSWEDLVKGLVGLALGIGLIAGAATLLAPAIPQIMALGVALLLLGGGIALVGVGAYLFARAIEIILAAGEGLIAFIPKLAKSIAEALPDLMRGLAEGIVEMIKVFTDAAPSIAKALGILLTYIIDTLIQLSPKLMELMRTLLDDFITLVYEYTEPLIAAGMHIIISFLQGISDNIEQITVLVATIIIKFLDALASQVPGMVDSVVNLFATMLTSVAEGLGELMPTLMIGVAVAFVTGFINGMESNLGPLISWFGSFLGNVGSWIGDTATTLFDKGVGLITGLFNGAVSFIGNVASFIGSIPGAVLGWIGDTFGTLVSKGIDFISGLLSGAVGFIGNVASFIGGIPGQVFGWIGDCLGTLISKGVDLIAGLAQGALDRFTEFLGWVMGLGVKIAEVFSSAGSWLLAAGESIAQGLWDGIKSIWGSIVSWVKDKVGDLIDTITHPWDIFSPSHLMQRLGVNIMQGWLIGFQDGYKGVSSFFDNIDAPDRASKVGDEIIDNMLKPISEVSKKLSDMPEFQPTITPVLDLTQVEKDSTYISKMIEGTHKVGANVSFSNAQTIAKAQRIQVEVAQFEEPTTPKTVTFEQNIYAPTQLSASDIYKQTRNQITMAKEELSIP